MPGEYEVQVIKGFTIDVTREYTVKLARQKDADYLFFLDSDLGLMRLDDVYRELRKVIGGAQAARRLTSAGA
jgi:hypothetical protein